MENLDKKYSDRLNDIKALIQNSEELGNYLDSEEYDDYKVLIDAFEDQLQELYNDVAHADPLQIIALEEAMLDDELEGLYIPKVVGYSVLRGSINDESKYRVPQEHFSKIVKYIAGSMNFDMIKLRVGQSIKTGFALSSDIWITNLIDSIKNKRVAAFLDAQRNNQYLVENNRKIARDKYIKQFASLNFYAADFPETAGKLAIDYFALRDFLLYRAHNDVDNNSLNPHIESFLANDKLIGTIEHIKLSMLLGMKFDISDKSKKTISKVFKSMGENDPQLSETYFDVLNKMHEYADMVVDSEADLNIAKLLIDNSTPEITEYYKLMNIVHSNGFQDEEAIDAVRTYYLQHQGQSDENECLRRTILNYFVDYVADLDADEYTEYFEVTKMVTQYINIFTNQKFNQSVKEASLKYIKSKLIPTYTDKRGRDYQDIKKFVQSTFIDLGFMNEKELKEFFKTKRKKKAE